MSLTWQDVLNIAPGDAAAFSDPSVPGGQIPTAAQAAILGYAAQQPNPAVWGSLLNLGIVYLAAHMAKIGLSRGSGPVTEESVDRLARTYAPPKSNPSLAYGGLNNTTYGQEYIGLLMSTCAALGVVP